MDGADCRRCRSRLWRHTERPRANEKHDRSRRGRSPLRRPTVIRQKMRAHGRQSFGAHRGSRVKVGGGAIGGGHDGRPHPHNRAHRRGSGATADLRQRPLRPRIRRLQPRADGRRILPNQKRLGGGDSPRPCLRAPRRPHLVRDGDPQAGRRARIRRSRTQALSGQTLGLQLLPLLQLEEKFGRCGNRPLPIGVRAHGILFPIHHARRLPLAQPRHVRFGPAATATPE